MQGSYCAARSNLCSLRQHGTAIVATVACLLFTTVAYAGCDEMTPGDFSDVINLSPEARALQEAVNAAYSPGGLYDPEKAKLNDGYIGTGTVEQFQRFCTDLNLIADDGQPLADRLIGALSAFKDIIDQNADWKNVVASDEFAAWADTLCDEAQIFGGFFRYSCGATLVPGGAFLLADYAKREQLLKEEQPVAAAKTPAPSEQDDAPVPTGLIDASVLTGLFELTEDDIEALKALGEAEPAPGDAAATARYRLEKQALANLKVAGLPQEFIASVGALQELEFRSMDALAERIHILFDNLAAEYLAVIAVVEADTSVADASGALQRARLRVAGLPTALVQKLPAGPDESTVSAVYGVVNEFREQVIDSIEFYTSTDGTQLTEPIPEAVLKGLEDNLLGVRFPNGEVFRTAVRLSTGLGVKETPATNAILRVARKSDRPPSQDLLQLAPIQWSGGDCGCGVSYSLGEAYPNHLYGIYPYWQAPPPAGDDGEEIEPEIIDFSMLGRIGYYGVTFEPNGEISQALHFQKERQSQDFSQFVKRAHQYRTKVDLIVYNSNWQEWLPENLDGVPEPRAKPEQIDIPQTLINSIGSLLTVQLDGPVNRIKPLISLGFSPSRTMGDGVTFDFDFRALDHRKQQWLFDNLLGRDFFERLWKSSRKEDESSINGNTYSTNIIVPVECMTTSEPDTVAGCSYYSLENLQRIAPYVDLFLVDMSTTRDDVLETMKDVLARIERPPVIGAEPLVEKERTILRKLVPLMGPHSDADNLKAKDLADNDNVQYADWFFGGYGNWAPNFNPTTKEALQKWIINSSDAEERQPVGGTANPKAQGYEFINDTIVPQLRDLESRVCSIACPYRWVLRTAIFLIVSVCATYVIASMWFFALRALYGYASARLSLMPATVCMAAIFIITMWCDPFWKEKHSEIMFLVLVCVLVYFLAKKRQKSLERDYP